MKRKNEEDPNTP